MSLSINIKPRYKPTWSVYEMAKNIPPDGWEDLFREMDEELRNISAQLDNDVIMHGPYYPAKRNIFKALELVKPQDVKVVIIGMDPYPGDYNGTCYADGLAFSVNGSIPLSNIPASLKNIFKEVKNNYPDAIINHGDLTSWALQGVLLLNACLTVRPGDPGSHKDLWLGFIKAIIATIRNNDNLVAVFWGAKAQKLMTCFGTKTLKLTSGHPSPKSAYLFQNNKHFLQINQHLISNGIKPIDFSLV